MTNAVTTLLMSEYVAEKHIFIQANVNHHYVNKARILDEKQKGMTKSERHDTFLTILGNNPRGEPVAETNEAPSYCFFDPNEDGVSVGKEDMMMSITSDVSPGEKNLEEVSEILNTTDMSTRKGVVDLILETQKIRCVSFCFSM